MKPSKLMVGEVVQLDPESSTMFGGCFMVVTEPKPWGAQGYIQAFGTDEATGGQAYYRAKWAKMEPTGGMAVWVAGSASEQPGGNDA
jgi:hypothetical protein